MKQATPDVETTPNKFMFGLHAGLDLWLAGKWSRVCGEASLRAGDFYCYDRGADTIPNGTSTTTNSVRMTDTNAAGMIDPGFRLATVRVMASADYVLKTHLSAGVRLGWAFNGGPKAIHYNSAGTASQKGAFIPVHAEARGTLWLRSLGKKGLHPSVHLSLGIAQVDANTPINAKLSQLPRRLDAWHRMGPAFVGAGFGALYSINKTFGIQLDVNGMFMLPKTGIVIEPSLGGVVGF